MRRALVSLLLGALLLVACGRTREVACQPESDVALCSAHDAECGELDVLDRCGQRRVLRCGDGCGPTEQCVDHRCACRPETYAELCAAAAVECGSVTAAGRCGETRTVSCGETCAGRYSCVDHTCKCTDAEDDAALCAREGFACGRANLVDACDALREVTCPDRCAVGEICSAHACRCSGDDEGCICGATGYQGDATTEADVGGRLDPSTNTLLDDAPGRFIDGAWQSCTENTGVALEVECVSIRGRATHVVAAAADGGTILVQRARSGCSIMELWLFDGTLDPPSFLGRDVTAELAGAGFAVTEGQRFALSPDGLTLIGRTGAGRLQAISRGSKNSTTWSAPSEDLFVHVNAALATDDVALSNDGLFLFIAAMQTTSRLWEARRTRLDEAFGIPVAMAGTGPAEINDGSYTWISGAASEGRTIYASRNFKTVVLTRDSLDVPLRPLNADAPLDLWYARPVRGCRALLGTMSAGGCFNEGVGLFTLPE